MQNICREGLQTNYYQSYPTRSATKSACESLAHERRSKRSHPTNPFQRSARVVESRNKKETSKPVCSLTCHQPESCMKKIQPHTCIVYTTRYYCGGGVLLGVDILDMDAVRAGMSRSMALPELLTCRACCTTYLARAGWEMPNSTGLPDSDSEG